MKYKISQIEENKLNKKKIYNIIIFHRMFRDT